MFKINLFYDHHRLIECYHHNNDNNNNIKTIKFKKISVQCFLKL